jgi:O-methyltransferase involved in polyketide biosynthesis
MVPKNIPVFITAQGLFMYYKKEVIKSLVNDVFKTFKEGYLMFDTVPVWLSKRTMSGSGWQLTTYYTAPAMPWGINRNKIKTTFRKWSENIVQVEEVPYFRDFPKLFTKWYLPTFITNRINKNRASTSVKIKFSRERKRGTT